MAECLLKRRHLLVFPIRIPSLWYAKGHLEKLRFGSFICQWNVVFCSRAPGVASGLANITSTVAYPHGYALLLQTPNIDFDA